MKRLMILAVLVLAGCTRGHHLDLSNAPTCPTRAGHWDARSRYYKGAVVCAGGTDGQFGERWTAYEAKSDLPPVPPPDKRYWKVY